MPEAIAAAAGALWLGVMTSISPCPLGSNIAAVAYISREAAGSWRVIANGILYAAGRSLAYAILAGLLTQGLMAAHDASHLLQTYVIRFIGPLLILIGLVMLELVSLPSIGGGLVGRLQERFSAPGYVGSVLLGALFAMSFCPVSAALFFGGLLPLATGAGSALGLPLVYGVGTAVPVVAFSVLIALGSQAVGKAFDKLSAVEKWLRRIMGGAFVIIGIYFTVVYTLGIG